MSREQQYTSHNIGRAWKTREMLEQFRIYAQYEGLVRKNLQSGAPRTRPRHRAVFYGRRAFSSMDAYKGTHPASPLYDDICDLL
jgi:hypothetical protein